MSWSVCSAAPCDSTTDSSTSLRCQSPARFAAARQDNRMLKMYLPRNMHHLEKTSKLQMKRRCSNAC